MAQISNSISAKLYNVSQKRPLLSWANGFFPSLFCSALVMRFRPLCPEGVRILALIWLKTLFPRKWYFLSCESQIIFTFEGKRIIKFSFPAQLRRLFSILFISENASNCQLNGIKSGFGLTLVSYLKRHDKLHQISRFAVQLEFTRACGKCPTWTLIN